MKKPFDKKVLILICFFSTTLRAQNAYVNEEADAAIRNNCLICLLNFPFYNTPLMLVPGKDSTATLYHNCHVHLTAGNLPEADRYARLIGSSISDTLNNQIYINSFFLKAKIYYYQNAVDAAVTEYNDFLSWNNIEPGLRADAYASLTKIYLQRRDYRKAYENMADSISIMNTLSVNAEQQKKSCRTNWREMDLGLQAKMKM